MIVTTTTFLEFLRKRGLQLFLVLIWLGVIFYFSSRPHSAEETELLFGSWNVLVRKVSHVSEYTILTGLFWWLYRLHARALNFAALSSICYAITDEFHQSFVPGRGSSPIDVLIDSSGVGVAILLLIIFIRRTSHYPNFGLMQIAHDRMDRRTQRFLNMRYSDKKETEDKVLKTVYHLSLEDPDRSTYLTNVQHATGFSQKEIQDICKVLIKRGHLERTNFRLTITDEGVNYAEKHFV